MTSKEIPLAGAVQARQQGASNIYAQDTHSTPAGQGEVSQCNSAVFQRQGPINGMYCVPIKSTAKISVFNRPVSNTKNQKKYSWRGLFELLTGE